MSSQALSSSTGVRNQETQSNVVRHDDDSPSAEKVGEVAQTTFAEAMQNLEFKKCATFRDIAVRCEESRLKLEKAVKSIATEPEPLELKHSEEDQPSSAPTESAEAIATKRGGPTSLVDAYYEQEKSQIRLRIQAAETIQCHFAQKIINIEIQKMFFNEVSELDTDFNQKEIDLRKQFKQPVPSALTDSTKSDLQATRNQVIQSQKKLIEQVLKLETEHFRAVAKMHEAHMRYSRLSLK